MVDIAYARPEEREEIAQFMNTVFKRAKWDIDGWRRLLAGRWCGPEGRYAIAVRDEGRLIGVLGLVYADRMTTGGRRTTADMTSWYVLGDYRGQGIGQKMLALATSDPEVTVTNFSSAKAAVSVLVNAGLTVLDKERLVWHPRTPEAGFKLHDDPLSLGDRISEKDRKVVADHQGLRLRHLTVETPDGLVTLVVYPQKKHDEYTTHEIMYLGNQPLFARYAAQIAAAVLPSEGAILSLDRRFAAPGIECDEVREFATPRYCQPGLLAPSEIDMLYSECVLLNIKIH
ncbi:GCN5-related N-acetyltransferase [Sulfitobacter noctilucicola]|uniref:GNAT superfamily N-acetyltransferase n=1 Tax=Sulfitobacter noctilucicola TaxID=1342301 RepID=A0A7W6MA70_9RHOB|nr:GNAT family N-acetyltransferase [Sulfitobacter noctilucicola]KIN63487.1 GCN5-related N-acetyltransferase [Sulfitobacter noctilucicola]MBB4175002.1 GNAT superfamily N-acetyltransferase [Sulfitobacter noctilucicola]